MWVVRVTVSRHQCLPKGAPLTTTRRHSDSYEDLGGKSGASAAEGCCQACTRHSVPYQLSITNTQAERFWPKQSSFHWVLDIVRTLASVPRFIFYRPPQTIRPTRPHTPPPRPEQFQPRRLRRLTRSALPAKRSPPPSSWPCDDSACSRVSMIL